MPGRLTATFPLLNGVPAAGTVEIEPVDAATLKPIPEIIDVAGNRIFSGRITPPVGDFAAPGVQLPAADDNVNPTGFAYLVTPLLEHINLDPVLVVILNGETVDLAQAVTPATVAPEYAELVGQAAAAAVRAEQAAAQAGTALYIGFRGDTVPDAARVYVLIDPDTNSIFDIGVPD